MIDLATWTVSEQAAVWQTVVLFLTAVILAWYTWETHVLRVTSARQANLVQSQLEIMRETLNREVQERTRQSRPLFIWGGGAAGATLLRAKFTNKGAEVMNLEISTDTMHVRAFVSPRPHLDAEQEGWVEFQPLPQNATFPASWNFWLSFTTALGSTERLAFRVPNSARSVVEPVI